ncbi:MAG: NADH-quinone oxidoreductase subunit L, partial [Oxalobacter sp.]|nr:NADH-quinone oxidoreductase subunit L [Oxalobacter sp.]
MQEQLSTTLLLVALLAPLVGALLTGLLGTRFGHGVVGRRMSMGFAIAGLSVSFVASLIVLFAVMDGARYDVDLYTWMTLGKSRLGIGFLVDTLSAMMMAVVTAISLLVHIYSVAYMAEERDVPRFFAYLSLFTFSMLALVMGNNVIQLFFGWEAVGVMSYLLIGFWLEKREATSAGLKAFLVNRIGDLGFIIGLGMIFAYTGSVHYADIFGCRDKLLDTVVPGLGVSAVTAICLFLFIGAIGKSAQFPLHVWLPDSMEGPTPVSALIHAATMVTAGIFMVSRLSPLYECSDLALSVIVIIGAITALFMGLVAMVQTDIKRVIAFSTLSQLGYMVAALGASAYH